MELKIEISESAWALLKAKKKDPKEFLRATVNCQKSDRGRNSTRGGIR